LWHDHRPEKQPRDNPSGLSKDETDQGENQEHLRLLEGKEPEPEITKARLDPEQGNGEETGSGIKVHEKGRLDEVYYNQLSLPQKYTGKTWPNPASHRGSAGQSLEQENVRGVKDIRGAGEHGERTAFKQWGEPLMSPI